MNPHSDDRAEAEHDAWLRAALRHAPDAELGAPPALSAAILREAGAPRPATAHRSPRWRPLWDAWSWLARPPVAAGFASVMVATVVGLMWWDRPPEEALPLAADTRVMAPRVAAPASASDARVAVAAPSPARVAVAAPAADKAEAAAPKPQARPPAVALHSEARARAADTAASAQTAQAAPPTQSERAEQAPVTPMAEPEAARKMAAPAALADAAAAPPPMMETARRAQAAAAAAAPAGLAAGTARLARPAASPSSSASWRADILAQPQHWTWQLDKGTAQAMTPAVHAWLARVDDVLAGAALPPSAVPEGKLLQLLHDGRLHIRLILGDTGLWLLPAEAGRAPLSAALSPESAATLKAALEDALR